MQIAIIGAGNVGASLGKGWARAGHGICFGVVNPQNPKHQTALQGAVGSRITNVADAVKDAEVLVLAVPWDAVPDAVRACGSLEGRLILDATNPLKTGPDGLQLALGFNTSGGEEVARLASGASVFKTMNQVGFAVMSNTQGYSSRPLMFVAGDDAAKKPLVVELISTLGFEAVDAGPLRNARLLEPYAMLWIDQAINHGASITNAFGMLHKEGAV